MYSPGPFTWGKSPRQINPVSPVMAAAAAIEGRLVDVRGW